MQVLQLRTSSPLYKLNIHMQLNINTQKLQSSLMMKTLLIIKKCF